MTGPPYVETDAIKREVKGCEAEVLGALGITWDPHKCTRCPYPDHVDKHPSWRWDTRLSIAFCSCINGSADDIFSVAQKVRGFSFVDAKLFVAEEIGRRDLIKGDVSNIQSRPALQPKPQQSPTPAPVELDALTARKIKRARRIWREAVPIQGTPGETYLRTRAITIPAPSSIRFLALTWHDFRKENMPALIVAAQKPDGDITAVHRIYLTPDCTRKIEDKRPRLALGPLRGNAMRLAATAPKLGITQGVEDGLSIMEMYGVPVWCGVGDGSMASMWIPETVTHLVVFGDADVRGRLPAERAAEAHARDGRKIEVVFPSEHKDFNELLQARQKRNAA